MNQASCENRETELIAPVVQAFLNTDELISVTKNNELKDVAGCSENVMLYILVFFTQLKIAEKPTRFAGFWCLLWQDRRQR